MVVPPAEHPKIINVIATNAILNPAFADRIFIAHFALPVETAVRLFVVILQPVYGLGNAIRLRVLRHERA